MLKTLINVSYERPYFIGPLGIVKGEPPPDLVRACFGLAPLPGGAGMYVGARRGMEFSTTNALQLTVLMLGDERVMGALLDFRGFRFGLALWPDAKSSTIQPQEGIPGDWHGLEMKRHFEKIKFHHGASVSHTVRFRW